MDGWIKLVVRGILEAFLLHCEQTGALEFGSAQRARLAIQSYIDRIHTDRK